MSTEATKQLRAVGYARTSSKNQKDNTSIPRQQEEIKKFIANNDWKFIRHYVDESLTGTTIEGRDDFKLMITDAANSQFDIVVILDISRFARDGHDIISKSKMLKTLHGVDVIDTKGYDTRNRKNAVVNFVKAGVAEGDRLTLLENTRYGCVDKAEDGLQWAGKTPFGRAFKETGKNSGEWSVSEDGKKMKVVLETYVDGDKSLHELAQEYGLTSAQTISRRVRECQLAANPYTVVFNTPEIGIVNRIVEVPAVPPVITKKLEKRVRAKMKLNKRRKRKADRDYLLSGIVRCAHCGKGLTGRSERGRSYYAHYKSPCPYNSIRLELLELHVMDYLTNFFFDKPAFEQAVKNALPTSDDRDAIVKDIEDNKKTLMKTNVKITNFVNEIGEGKKSKALSDALKSAEAEKEALERRGAELEQTLATMPDPEVIKSQAEYIRMKLSFDVITKDWMDRPFKDLRRFLHFLFTEDPIKNNYGILLGKKNDNWAIDFEGCFDFNHSLVTSDSDKHIHESLRMINIETKQMFEKGVIEADANYVKSCKQAGIDVDTDVLFNGKANMY